MFRLVAIVSGNGSNLQSIIDAINKNIIKNTEISSVVSTSAKAYALIRARDNGIKHAIFDKKSYDTDELRQSAMASYISNISPDLIVCCGCLLVLNKGFVDMFENKIINIHPSLIPKYCGLGFYGIKIHEAVIAEKESITGATVHFVNHGIDEGKIIIQKNVKVLQNDTPQSLGLRVMQEAEQHILPQAINIVLNNI